MIGRKFWLITMQNNESNNMATDKRWRNQILTAVFERNKSTKFGLTDEVRLLAV